MTERHPQPKNFSFWLIQSRASPGAEVEEHLGDLYVRSESVRARCTVPVPGVEFGLTIVQDMDGTESQGHGFVLETKWLEWLASVSGQLNVDQYIH